MTQIVSSISGIEIYAPSAGYAPTNSADVSAIASAYQVVSATGTQLYAGTAHVTSINGDPISASRAGNAANASMATSAYYDGTGRLISALPDAATVSSIASSYAESAASGKLDTSAIECDTASAITAIGGSSIGGAGGVVTSTGSAEYVIGGTSKTGISGINNSAIIAVSANSADSANFALSADTFAWGAMAVSGTQTVRLGGDNSAFDYVSGGTGAGIFLNGSFGTAYYKVNELVQNRQGTGQIKFNIGNGGSQITVSSNAGGKFSACGPGKASSYYSAFNDSASAAIGVRSSIASARLAGGQAYIILNDSAASATAYASSISSWNDCYDTVSANSASWGGGATGDYVEKSALVVTIGTANTAVSTAFVQGSSNSASGASFAQGRLTTAGYHSFAQGYNNSAKSLSFAQGSQNTALHTSFAQGNSNIASAISFACGEGVWAINTAAAFGHYNLSYDGNTATGHSVAFVIGDGPDYDKRHDLMRVTKNGEITLFSSTADTTGTGIMSAIRAISAAATGGVDSATVSAIASAYQVVSSTASGSGEIFGQTAFYTTEINGLTLSAQEAALATYATNAGSAGAAPTNSSEVSAIASGYASGKADSSSLSSYALSADVSGTVDVVSTQSANWGGSALALSAGPGITLTKSGNTLVAGLDETLLWSGEIGVEGDTATLSENIEHFQYITIYANPVYAGADNVVSKFETRSGLNACKFGTWSQDGASTYLANYNINLSGTSAGIIRAKRITINNSNGTLTVTPNTITGTYTAPVRKIVGLNRTAGV